MIPDFEVPAWTTSPSFHIEFHDNVYRMPPALATHAGVIHHGFITLRLCMCADAKHRPAVHGFPNSESRGRPLMKLTRPPLAALPSIPNACGALSIDALFPQSLLKSASWMTQRPRDALVDLWLPTSLYWKLRRVTVRDSGGPNENRAGPGHRGDVSGTGLRGEERTHAVSPYMGLMPPAYNLIPRKSTLSRLSLTQSHSHKVQDPGSNHIAPNQTLCDMRLTSSRCIQQR